MNKVKVLFFATLKDRAGVSAADVQIPDGSTVGDLKAILFDEFPELPRSKANLLVAVNKEYAFDQEAIPPDAEIALFPPVSGG